MVNLRTLLNLTNADINKVIAKIATECETDSEYDVSKAQVAGDLARWIRHPPIRYMTKSATRVVENKPRSVEGLHSQSADPIVITGISLGLQAASVYFLMMYLSDRRGETCISGVSVNTNNVYWIRTCRLIKGRDGSVNMERDTEFTDIPQLAGIKGAFDLAAEFGIDPKVVLAWDITTQLAVASGLLALRDAGIPLTPVEQVGKGGLRLITNWEVPQIQRDRTGIVFASCFPGLQMAMKHAKQNGDDGEGRFDRRFLFQTLNMGHSQFAQYTGIRGPNTTINLACASATAAFGVAEDWIKTNRADRVIIISADDVTGDDLWEWIGGGFAASGAASTHNVVEETALPFDRRRNGLIWGWGQGFRR